MSNSYASEASQRTSVGEAFNNETRYWGARFARTDLVSPWKLLWHTAKDVKQHTTTARILPGKCPTHTVDFDPYRIGQGANDFGDWIRWHWAWRRSGYGDPITFLLQPGKNLDQQNPANLLYKTVKYAVENNRGAKGHWGAMISDKGGRGSVIGKPKRMFMVMCCIFEHAGLWYDVPKGLGEDDLPVLLDIGSDAAKGVIKHCKERYTQDDMAAAGFSNPAFEDWFVNGDPISLDQGKFFEFYPEVSIPPHIIAANRPTAPSAPVGPLKLSPAQMRQRAFRDDDEEEGGRDIKGYTVNCYSQVGPDAYTQWSAELTDFEPALRAKVPPWAEALIFPTPQEQAAMIAPLLRLQDSQSPNGRLYLDVIEMAWADHKSWLPDPSSDLWAEWVERESAQGSDIPDARRPRDDGQGEAQNGPALNRRPTRVDETLAGRAVGQAPAAPAAGPVVPNRMRPGGARAATPAAPAGPAEPAEDGESAAEHFARMEQEEMELKAKGVRPDFPTPGTAPQAADVTGGNWKAKLAERRAGNGVAASAPSQPAAASAPAQRQAVRAAAPAAQVPQDDGGGFTSPPDVGGTVSVKDRLAALRAVKDKIPKA
jgi:hypothetical protein